MKKLSNGSQKRMLLLGLGFIAAILFLAVLTSNMTFQQVTHYSDAGFEVILAFTPACEEISRDVFYYDNKSVSFDLRIILTSDAAPFNYIEISQRIGSAAASVLLSSHDIVSTQEISVTLDNIPVTYKFEIYARQQAVGIIGTYIFMVECAGYGVEMIVETTTEPVVATGFDLTIVISLIALIIINRKQK